MNRHHYVIGSTAEAAVMHRQQLIDDGLDPDNVTAITVPAVVNAGMLSHVDGGTYELVGAHVPGTNYSDLIAELDENGLEQATADSLANDEPLFTHVAPPITAEQFGIERGEL